MDLIFVIFYCFKDLILIFILDIILDIFIKVNNISKIKGENKLYLYFVMNYIVIFFIIYLFIL